MNNLWRVLLVVSLALGGLYAGAVLGATYLVPKSAGLAGGAMVLGYAVLGAVIGAVVGFLVAALKRARPCAKWR